MNNLCTLSKKVELNLLFILQLQYREKPESQNFSAKIAADNWSKNPENAVPQNKKELIDKLLLERIPLAGIARVVGISDRWLQGYINNAMFDFSGDQSLKLEV